MQDSLLIALWESLVSQHGYCLVVKLAGNKQFWGNGPKLQNSFVIGKVTYSAPME